MTYSIVHFLDFNGFRFSDFVFFIFENSQLVLVYSSVK